MKFILVFFINVIFTNVISEWIDLNNHIINSKSYKISFKQEYEVIIGESTHYASDPGSIIYFNDSIRYESIDRIIIANQDSLKMLNKYSNQIFIDHSNKRYDLLASTNLSDILSNGKFINSKDGNYYINIEDAVVKIYFLNKNLVKIEISYDDIIIRLSNIELSIVDTNEAVNYFQIENDQSEIFDLRVK